MGAEVTRLPLHEDWFVPSTQAEWGRKLHRDKQWTNEVKSVLKGG